MCQRGCGCITGRTGCSRVSTAGAAGFLTVVTALRAYAATRGYGPVYFGPQAASGFELANGTDIADWAYGACVCDNLSLEGTLSC